MKKILFLLVLFLALSFFAFTSIKNKVKQDLTQVVPYPSIAQTPTLSTKKAQGATRKSLFVPYWSLNGKDIDPENYDQFLYFGITSAKDGINKQEAGFMGIDKFLVSVPKGTGKQLVVRMIDSSPFFFALV